MKIKRRQSIERRKIKRRDKRKIKRREREEKVGRERRWVDEI